jgi:hypothetical protein
MTGHDDQQALRSPISRRSALRGGAAAGIAGAAMGATAASPALAAAARGSTAAASAHDEAAAHGSESVTVHVRDARTGEVEIFRGETQTRVRDRALAAQILRASR